MYGSKNRIYEPIAYNVTMQIQLNLEQHGFELHRSAYMQVFFNKYIL